MKVARAVLVTFGVGITLFGGWELLTENRPKALMGLAFWMLGALVLHDGVLAGIIVLVNRLLRAFLSGIALVAAQTGIGIVATFAIIWVPVVLANGKVTQISALPLNYGSNLIGVLAISSVITVGLVVFFIARKKATATSSPELEVKNVPEALHVEEGGGGLEQGLLDAELLLPGKKRWVLPLTATLIGAGALIFVLLIRRAG